MFSCLHISFLAPFLLIFLFLFLLVFPLHETLILSSPLIFPVFLIASFQLLFVMISPDSLVIPALCILSSS